jgi:GNAT superfamily N-acetyltransferase
MDSGGRAPRDFRFVLPQRQVITLLIRYRAFQNWDPPALAEIWRSQPPLRGRMQPVTPSMLEDLVFSKPYFDRHGLILAVDGARPVGFAHATFGANEDLSGIDEHQGSTNLVMTSPHPDRAAISLELVSAAEDYLRRRGAKQLYAGTQFPFNGFYVGMYGGAEMCGILASDTAARELFCAADYRETNRRLLLHRSLIGCRSVIDFKQMQLRKKFQVACCSDVLPDNWWENCVWSHAEWLRAKLTLRGGGETIISATFCEILPLSRAWGVRTVGLVRLEDTPEAREQGLTTLLLGEAFRQMAEQNMAQVEVQAPAGDESLLQIYKQLGLVEYDQAGLYCKNC